MDRALFPVLLGADIGCYSLARAFYEAGGYRPTVLGRQALGAVRYSRLLHFSEVAALSDASVLCRELLALASRTPGKTRLLLPTTDEYALALMQKRETLSSAYILPLPPDTVLPLLEKDGFYRVAAAHGVPVPETVILEKLPSYDDCRALLTALGAPLVIKPASSAEYWHHPFPGMEKVYFAHNASEAECILSGIFASGYPGRVLAQRHIPGGDTAGCVLTLYFDRNGRPVLRAAARVLLEEHTPKGRGNYAALLTTAPPPLTDEIVDMLEELGYRGFANLDLRFDARDGRFYALELNPRLGRSNYLLCGVHANPATLLIRDRILQEDISPLTPTAECLYRTVPLGVVRRYTADAALFERAVRLHRMGREVCPWYTRADLLDVRRTLYLLAHRRRERKKFARYAPLVCR